MQHGLKLGIFTFVIWLIASPAAQALVPRFAYVVNGYDDTLSIFSIDAETGRLRNNGHVPTGQFPSSVVVHPSGKYVYVTEQTGHKVSAFKVNQVTGKLTALPGSPFDPKIVSPFWSASDKEGKYLYIAGRNSNAVAAMAINENTGELKRVKGSPYPGGYLPRSVIVHPSNRFVYMVTINDDSISAYKVDPSNGALEEIEGSPFDAGDAPQYIKVHPNGKFAFVTSWNNKQLLTFEINQKTGALNEVQSLQLGDEVSPFGLTIHPDGRFVYVANWFGGTYGYVVNAETGKLTAMQHSPFANFGDLPVQVEVDPSGQFAYVTNYESYHVSAYKIDAETGELTAGATTSTRAGPRSIGFLMGDKAPVRSSRFAYVVNAALNTVNAYKVNEKNGRLSFIASAKTELMPRSLAIDPLNQFVYIANAKSNSISAFVIDKQTGKLTEMKGSPFKTGEYPQSIMIDYNGKFLYTSNQKANTMSVFTINPASGFLTELLRTDLHYASPYLMRKQPGSILLHPSNRVLYVVYPEENKISFFSYYSHGPLVVESMDGSPMSFDDKPEAMAMDPDGRYAYLISEKSKTISAYDVNVRVGIMKSKGNSIKTGGDPVAVVVDPSGRFIYVVNRGTDSVSIFEADPDTGLISKKTAEVKVGKDPKNIVIESSGKFAYVVSRGSNEISIFDINDQNGKLEFVDKIAVGLRPMAMVMTTEIN